jgi:hypothetical protein
MVAWFPTNRDAEMKSILKQPVEATRSKGPYETGTQHREMLDRG